MLLPTLTVQAAGTYTSAGGMVYWRNAVGNSTLQLNSGVDGALLGVRNIDRVHTNTITSGTAVFDPAFDPLTINPNDGYLIVYSAGDNTWRVIGGV